MARSDSLGIGQRMRETGREVFAKAAAWNKGFGRKTEKMNIHSKKILSQ
jgi:hypothetical protein